jgi:arginine repressor
MDGELYSKEELSKKRKAELLTKFRQATLSRMVKLFHVFGKRR